MEAAGAVRLGAAEAVQEWPREEDLQGGGTRISSRSMMVIVQMLLQSHQRDDHTGAALSVLRAAALVRAACAV